MIVESLSTGLLVVILAPVVASVACNVIVLFSILAVMHRQQSNEDARQEQDTAIRETALQTASQLASTVSDTANALAEVVKKNSHDQLLMHNTLIRRIDARNSHDRRRAAKQ